MEQYTIQIWPLFSTELFKFTIILLKRSIVVPDLDPERLVWIRTGSKQSKKFRIRPDPDAAYWTELLSNESKEPTKKFKIFEKLNIK